MTQEEYKEEVVDFIRRAIADTYSVLDLIIRASKELPLAEFEELIENIKRNEDLVKSDRFSMLLSRAEEVERLKLQTYVESITEAL